MRNCYIDSVTVKDLQKVVECRSTNTLKFGSGLYFQGMKKVKVSAKIGSRSIFIETDIVNIEMLMLLTQNLT